ncbi:right-handed parallel beta-helix repeat-containing protein [Acinetobacter lwoffii]|uniref:right-handed parallel beta-helix repeat-containing protein n=1 Tax=Acinetobacter lwoffii TaxID=28090 RepID=UPI0021CDCDB2|nr:right-handed parallel beta-helix repeat-containing protein [Acinetobacter lwoffii]MCU4422530.1 right-handed parallel beta-helix repeat-containing protein [Acinetobacter lwoffii]
MTWTFENCEFFDNGRDGINAPKGVNVIVKNTKSYNNGRNGLTAHKDSNVVLEDFSAFNNGLHGVYAKDSDLLDYLGLPNDVNVEALKELIQQLKALPEEKRRSKINLSFLGEFLSKSESSTTIINNLLEIAEKINF